MKYKHFEAINHDKRKLFKRAPAAAAGLFVGVGLTSYSSDAEAWAIVDDIIAGISSAIPKSWKELIDNVIELFAEEKEITDKKTTISNGKATDAVIEAKRKIANQETARVLKPLEDLCFIEAEIGRYVKIRTTGEKLKSTPSRDVTTESSKLQRAIAGMATGNDFNDDADLSNGPIEVNEEQLESAVEALISSTIKAKNPLSKGITPKEEEAVETILKTKLKREASKLGKVLVSTEVNPILAEQSSAAAAAYARKNLMVHAIKSSIPKESSQSDELEKASIGQAKLHATDPQKLSSIENSISEVAVATELNRVIGVECAGILAELKRLELNNCLLAARLLQ